MLEKIISLVGIDGDQKVIAKKDSIILFARSRNEIGNEAFLLGERIDNI